MQSDNVFYAEFESDEKRLEHQKLIFADRKDRRYTYTAMVLFLVTTIIFLVLVYTKENYVTPFLASVAGFGGYHAGRKSVH